LQLSVLIQQVQHSSQLGLGQPVIRAYCIVNIEGLLYTAKNVFLKFSNRFIKTPISIVSNYLIYIN
jgi:hypothetical protein